VMVRVDSQQISFEIEGRFVMTSRLIAGDFVNYDRFTPKGAQVSVTIDRETMLDAAKRLAIAAREDTHRIHCTYAGATLKMRAQAAGGNCDADEELQITLEGGPATHCLNVQQLMAVLSAFDTDEVHLVFDDALRPVLFRPVGGDEYFAVVMPMHAG
jgi:DNA polymerase III subunit beta